MKWIDRMERRFGGWAIPHLTVYLLLLQAVGVYLLATGRVAVEDLALQGGVTMALGQWWRVASFMMIPKTLSPIWLFFSFYVFFVVGSSLEREWGAFRFNLFVLFGYLLTLAGAFLFPSAIVTNLYFLGGIFLAFATVFPEIEFLLFFVLPVKVKWLGWLTAGIYVLALFSPDLGSRVSVAAALLNYALFFGGDFLRNRRAATRRKAYEAHRERSEAQPFHVCATCGASDKDPEPHDFRYCSACGACFCERHLREHACTGSEEPREG